MRRQVSCHGVRTVRCAEVTGLCSLRRQLCSLLNQDVGGQLCTTCPAGCMCFSSGRISCAKILASYCMFAVETTVRRTPTLSALMYGWSCKFTIASRQASTPVGMCLTDEPFSPLSASIEKKQVSDCISRCALKVRIAPTSMTNRPVAKLSPVTVCNHGVRDAHKLTCGNLRSNKCSASS